MGEDHQAGLKITWLSLFINIGLGVAKVCLGVVVNSKALLADGLHSLTDLSTDLAVLFGLYMARKPEDDNHHYGHHKFASLSTLFIAIVLIIFCLLLIYQSAVSGQSGRPVEFSWAALGVAGTSLVAKEWLYWKSKMIAKREHSSLMMANALHHRSDSLSSLLVLSSLLAVYLGGDDWLVLDRVVAVVLAGWLGVEGGKMFLKASNDLLDAAPDEAMINDIREHILPVDGVKAYHQLRIRRIGQLLEVDLHLQLPKDFTVEKGHQIASEVRSKILQAHPQVVEVLIHVEPATPDHLKQIGVNDSATGD